MKYLIFLFFLYNPGNFYSPQNDIGEVEKAVNEFAKAVVEADKEKFEKMLSKDLVYGHSSGAVQNKQEFIEEIISLTPFDYLSVNVSDQTIKISNNVAVVRHIYSAKAKNNSGEIVDIRIGNMMVWVKKGKDWNLLSRQAYRLP
ncbi:nuclear transport factor 2 family protein [Shivajiella indica]|uniref:Nuclear transport factor 2 family protein n=1 Tax=Shivajiella indica TaxID=872115 RepID=A0ABW5BB48_9BACT